ncbi:MAG TPA: hypothetical protein VGH03_01860 [Caulobacteraceae bacterium]
MPETSILSRALCASGADVGYVDELCLAEILEILDRYGRRERFGVVLLDPPFPVDDNEVLVEACDATSRTLTVQPVMKAALDGLDCVTTRWRLDCDVPKPACVRVKRPAIP